MFQDLLLVTLRAKLVRRRELAEPGEELCGHCEAVARSTPSMREVDGPVESATPSGVAVNVAGFA